MTEEQTSPQKLNFGIHGMPSLEESKPLMTSQNKALIVVAPTQYRTLPFLKGSHANGKSLQKYSLLTLLLAGCKGGGSAINGSDDPPEEQGIRQLSTDFYDFEGKHISTSFSNISVSSIFALQLPGEQIDYYPTIFLGPYGANSEPLEFTTDITSQDVVVSFDFYRVNTWDADVGATSNDRFILEINGEVVISELFGPFTSDACSITRSSHCDDDLAVRTGISDDGMTYTITKVSNIQEHGMGGGGFFATKYFIQIDVGAVDGPLNLVFLSTLDENLLNEYFGIDNFKVVSEEIFIEQTDVSAPELLGFSIDDKLIMINETARLNIDAADQSGFESVKIAFSNSVGGELVVTATSISDALHIQGLNLDAANYFAEYISLIDASSENNQSVYFRDGSLRGASDHTTHSFDLSSLDFQADNSIIINAQEF